MLLPHHVVNSAVAVCRWFAACLQVIAQLELWNERKSGRYENKVYVLPKHLDEKVGIQKPSFLPLHIQAMG